MVGLLVGEHLMDLKDTITGCLWINFIEQQ